MELRSIRLHRRCRFRTKSAGSIGAWRMKSGVDWGGPRYARGRSVSGQTWIEIGRGPSMLSALAMAKSPYNLSEHSFETALERFVFETPEIERAQPVGSGRIKRTLHTIPADFFASRKGFRDGRLMGAHDWTPGEVIKAGSHPGFVTLHLKCFRHQAHHVKVR